MASLAVEHRAKAIDALRSLIGVWPPTYLGDGKTIIDSRSEFAELFVDEILCAAKAWIEEGK